jgi:hypothetical protein
MQLDEEESLVPIHKSFIQNTTTRSKNEVYV